MTVEQQIRAAALAAAVALNGQLGQPAKMPTVINQAEKLARWIEQGVIPVPGPGEMW